MSRPRRRLALVWLPLIAGAVAGGWALVPARTAQLASSPVQPAASVIYQQDCAACHGSDGRGTPRGPDLAGVGEAAVDFQLTTGRMPKKDVSSRLPPYTAVLPEADIRALDQYVTALVAHGGPGIPSVNPAAGDQAKGQQLFMEDCAACHNWDGSGGILYSRPVPSLREATPTQAGEAVRTGPAAMPVFGPGQLSASQLNDIVAYMQTMKHPQDQGGDSLSHLGPFAEGAVVWLIVMVGVIFVARWIGKRG